MKEPRRHYCPVGRHLYECQHQQQGLLGYLCRAFQEEACDECSARLIRFSTFLVPIICERCGIQKRDKDGRGLYVSFAWRKGKRMVCPGCLETEKLMAGMEKIVNTWDEDDGVPF